MTSTGAPSCVLLVNPFANGGRAARHIEAARRAISRIGSVSVELTRAQGDEPRIVQHAIDTGARALFVLGGDGTISHAARAMIGQKSTIPLAILAAGTGNDFAKSLGAPVKDFDAMVSLVADNVVRTIDAGRVDDYVFVNSAGFGFDARVQEETLKPSLFRGKALYVKAALNQLFRYRGFRARLQFANDVRDDPWCMVVFANGKFFGGAFNIAPDARVDDGALDCIALADASALVRTQLFAGALRGAHLTHANVRMERGTQFTLEFDAPPLFEADGELRRATSSRVQIHAIPAALRVIAPS